jgi:hypothetical protein
MRGAMICPICGKADQVEKVSTIYLTGIEVNRGSRNQTASRKVRPTANNHPGLAGIPALRLTTLSRRLTPPTPRREAFAQPIHPDMYVLAVSLILSVFLYGIVTRLPVALLPLLALLAGLYALYFWRRKSIIDRFKRQQVYRLVGDEMIKQAIERWMRLYYCARDDGVFEPGDDQFIPTSQMNHTLLQE